MDDQTERLRDIFMDVADGAAVTEDQTESHGTLAADPEAVDNRLADVVSRMRERFDFEADLPTETYVAVVRGFYDGRADEAIAADIDRESETVRLARADLHLVEAGDAGVNVDELGDRVAAGEDPESAAAAMGAADPTFAAAVYRALDRSRRVSQRFRSEFEEILTDADISVRLTADAQEDGLADATEDAEVDVDF